MPCARELAGLMQPHVVGHRTPWAPHHIRRAQHVAPRGEHAGASGQRTVADVEGNRDEFERDEHLDAADLVPVKVRLGESCLTAMETGFLGRNVGVFVQFMGVKHE